MYRCCADSYCVCDAEDQRRIEAESYSSRGRVTPTGMTPTGWTTPRENNNSGRGTPRQQHSPRFPMPKNSAMDGEIEDESVHARLDKGDWLGKDQQRSLSGGPVPASPSNLVRSLMYETAYITHHFFMPLIQPWMRRSKMKICMRH